MVLRAGVPWTALFLFVLFRLEEPDTSLERRMVNNVWKPNQCEEGD